MKKRNFKNEKKVIIFSFSNLKILKLNITFLKVFFLFFFFSKSFLFSHEFWIEPKKFFYSKNEYLEASLKVGEMFDGINLGYFPRNFERFDIFFNDKLIKIEGILGDNPAAKVKLNKKGLGIIIHQTTDNYLNYGEWKKFEDFILEKDLKGVKDIHIKKGFPEKDFVEIYSRYAKSIIIVDKIKGNDKYFGMETEFVLDIDSFFTNKKEINLTLFYQNKPRKNVQVEIFERDKNNIVRVKKKYTDELGNIKINVKKGFSYLINSVVMREYKVENADLNKSSKTLWESLWASITFSIPK